MNGKQTSEKPRVHPNNPTPARPRERNLAARPRREISWGDINNQLLRDCIVAVADGGGAIMLSTTSDKGAFSITVLDGNDKVREWPNTVEDAESTLTWLVNMFASD